MSRTRKIKVVISGIVTAVVLFPVLATAGKLTAGEEAHLIFMRSEEKLARDVYLTLACMYSDMPIFETIATQSEQTHTDTMRDMLKKFKVDDPEPSTLPGTPPPAEQIGVFENPDFAFYFEGKFSFLVDNSATLLDALYVGALIEELDMKDINYCNMIIYEVFGLPLPPPIYCGLSVTDVRALEKTLGNLLEGSENHLCAFVSQIGPMIQPDCYSSQYLTQEEVFGIISATCPEFIGYVCEP